MDCFPFCLQSRDINFLKLQWCARPLRLGDTEVLQRPGSPGRVLPLSVLPFQTCRSHMHIIAVPSFPPHHRLLLMPLWSSCQPCDAFSGFLYTFPCHHQETQMSSGWRGLCFSKPPKDTGFFKLYPRNLWRDLWVTLSLQKNEQQEVKKKHGSGKQSLLQQGQSGRDHSEKSELIRDGWLLVLTIAKVKTTDWFTKGIIRRAFSPDSISLLNSTVEA